MTVKLLRYPTDEDWMFVKQCALVTVGKDAVTPPDAQWKYRILRARHSPIRELHFAFLLVNIPYWVSVHLVRHHVGCQPYVRSQRTDRTGEDRTVKSQDEPVSMMWTMNAEALMTIANKRLCRLASPETRTIVQMMCNTVLANCPEFNGLLVPACEYNGSCHEMFNCERSV